MKGQEHARDLWALGGPSQGPRPDDVTEVEEVNVNC